MDEKRLMLKDNYTFLMVQLLIVGSSLKVFVSRVCCVIHVYNFIMCVV